MVYKVSLILIVYNTKKWITECLESIVNQTFKNMEIIIINNASTDGTTEILTGYASKYENIIYKDLGQNAGGATSGNEGIRMATGEYVFLMDSDDVLPLNAIEKLYETAQDTKSDIIIGRGKSIINGAIYNNRFKADHITWSQKTTVQDIREAPFLIMAPFYWGKLYRRSMLLEHDVFMVDGMLNADRYFNSKALKVSQKISVITDLVYCWRRHEKESTNKSITQKRTQREFFLDRMESIRLTEDLFREPGYERLYEYVCCASMLRLLILAKESLEDTSFGEVYREEMEKYLHHIPDSFIENCMFMKSKDKVVLYLLKAHRFGELTKVLDTSHRIEKKEVLEYVEYEYLDVPGLPSLLCRELRTRIKRVFGSIEREKEKYILRLQIPIWDGANIHLEALYMMNKKKVECWRFVCEEVVKTENSITCCVTIPKHRMEMVKQEGFIYFSLAYIVNDAVVKRARVTNTKEELLCVKNGKREEKIMYVSPRNLIDKSYLLKEKTTLQKAKERMKGWFT